jgi:hypothetical protein
MILKYQSGEEIKKGDRVLFHGEPGEIELVATKPGNSETEWFVETYGGGVMVRERVMGRTFIPGDQIEETEDLEFVSRSEGQEIAD